MTKYNPEYDYRKGWNAVVPTVFHPITEEDTEEQAAKTAALIDDTRKKLGHFTDED